MQNPKIFDSLKEKKDTSRSLRLYIRYKKIFKQVSEFYTIKKYKYKHIIVQNDKKKNQKIDPFSCAEQKKFSTEQKKFNTEQKKFSAEQNKMKQTGVNIKKIKDT